MLHVACFGQARGMFSLIGRQVAENDWSLWVTTRLCQVSGIEMAALVATLTRLQLTQAYTHWDAAVTGYRYL